MTESKFKVGQRVQFVDEPHDEGLVEEVRQDTEFDQYEYRVIFDDGTVENELVEADLTPAEE